MGESLRPEKKPEREGESGEAGWRAPREPPGGQCVRASERVGREGGSEAARLRRERRGEESRARRTLREEERLLERPGARERRPRAAPAQLTDPAGARPGETQPRLGPETLGWGWDPARSGRWARPGAGAGGGRAGAAPWGVAAPRCSCCSCAPSSCCGGASGCC